MVILKNKINYSFEDKEWLYNEYINKRKTVKQIAKECKVSASPIRLRLEKYNIPKRSQKDRIKEENPNWKGGIIYMNGYKKILMKNHPKACKNGYVYEHTLIMEKETMRSLRPEEDVHHIDENKENNNINNLYLCKDYGEHMKIHRQLKKIALQIYKSKDFCSIDFDKEKGQYYIKERKN